MDTIDNYQAMFTSDSVIRPIVYHDIAYVCDTCCGTEVVPADLVGDISELDPPEQWELLADFLEAEPDDIEIPPELHEGWLARTTAPGYADCTSWSIYGSELEAWEALADLYGDDSPDTLAACLEADGPADDDIVISDHRGGGYWVTMLDQRFLEHDAMDAAIREWMDEHQYWCNVWIVSDHGNMSPYPID